MGSHKEWLLVSSASLRYARKANLRRLLAQASDDDPVLRDEKSTRDQLQCRLQALRAAHWNAAQPPVPQAVSTRYPPRGRHHRTQPAITAAECNDFLRTLPRLPLHGEEQE